MRRGMNSLAIQVQEGLGRDPHTGDLYVFRGKRGHLIKILWHDGIGMRSMPSGWSGASLFGHRQPTERSRLFAGGKWIRTVGPGLAPAADNRPAARRADQIASLK